jgi:hypothetical protein
MGLSAGLIPRLAAGRRADRRWYRLRGRPSPLGATRFRLIQALADLGIYAEKIRARLREERRQAQLCDAQRLVRLRDDELRFAVSLRAQRRARSGELERPALTIEQQRFVRLLKEELAFQAMTEQQKALEQFAEQVVSWLSADDSGA